VKQLSNWNLELMRHDQSHGVPLLKLVRVGYPGKVRALTFYSL
jgi:hypothetical protein